MQNLFAGSSNIFENCIDRETETDSGSDNKKKRKLALNKLLLVFKNFMQIRKRKKDL